MSTTVQQLQAQIPALQKAIDDATTALNNAVMKRDEYRQKAQACDAARALYTLDWKKDKACSIADRDLFYNEWNKYDGQIGTYTNAVQLAQTKLANLNKQIATVQSQEQNQLLSDPKFNLQNQQQQAEAAAKQKEIEEAQKTKRLYFMIGGIVAGIGVLFGGIALIMKFKKAAA